MKGKLKKIIKITMCLITALLLFACDSKISRINIHGIYTGMGYEAVVEDGTITIYSTSFFDREVYWYGTCNAHEMNDQNIIVSKRLATERDNSFFGFGFGFDFGMNRSRVSEREILFTEDSLTFVYDMAGMAVNNVTLYKNDAGKKKVDPYSSNAEKEDPNYVEPSKPLPHELPRGETAPSTEAPTEPSTEAPTVTIPEDNFVL